MVNEVRDNRTEKRREAREGGRRKRTKEPLWPKDEKTNERETYGLDELVRRAGISQRTRGPNLYEDETDAHVNKKKKGGERENDRWHKCNRDKQVVKVEPMAQLRVRHFRR